MVHNPPMIYLNNAATGWPKPPEVLAPVNKSLSLPVYGGGRTTGSQGEDYITMAREALSRLLTVDPFEHMVFTQNATDSLNLLILSESIRCTIFAGLFLTANGNKVIQSHKKEQLIT